MAKGRTFQELQRWIGRGTTLMGVALAQCLQASGTQAADLDNCFQSNDLVVIIESCSLLIGEQVPNWQRAMAFDNRASAFFRSGELKRAEEDYTRALELDPRYPKAYYNRGTLRQKRGDLQGALNDLSQAIMLDSRYLEAYNNRGQVY